MVQTLHLTVRLFGAFRRFHSAPISLEVASGTNAHQIKQMLGKALHELNPLFSEFDLLDKSALATNTQVLPEETQLYENADLAILPPVCGG